MTETQLDELRAEWFQKGWMAALRDVILTDDEGEDAIYFAKEQVRHMGA